MVINPKGGSGKSTLASNLAGYYACFGVKVALVDMDQQKTSLSWLRARPADRAAIFGLAATSGQPILPSEAEYIIYDTPAAIETQALREYLALADTIIIPVLPSPIDIRAASFFIYQLLLKNRITSEDKRIALIANRAKLRSVAYKALTRFTDTLKIPLITSLRDSRNYLLSAQQGLSIFELPGTGVLVDIEQWQPLLDWLGKTESPWQTQQGTQR